MGRLKKYYNNDEKRSALNEASHRHYLRNKEEKNAKDLARYYKKKAAKEEAKKKLELPVTSSIIVPVTDGPLPEFRLQDMLDDKSFIYCSGSKNKLELPVTSSISKENNWFNPNSSISHSICNIPATGSVTLI